MTIVQDKPWVYAHLLNIQKELGEENFPLIDQSFYASASEMVKLKVSKLQKN